MSEADSGQVETILEVGAEGGSIRLEGQRDAAGAWRRQTGSLCTTA